MMLFMFVWLSWVASLTAAAAVYSPRQVLSSITHASCPVTVTQYITVTKLPPTVTIAVPDYSAISKSLASASTIDSIVVVEQGQDAPTGFPPNTNVTEFTHTIVAPAFEATDINTGTSAVYVSVGPNTTNWSYTPSDNVVIGTTTVSVLPQPFETAATTSVVSSRIIRSTVRVTTTLRTSFATPPSGWNGSHSNSTNVSALSGSAVIASGHAHSTSYVATSTHNATYVASAANSTSMSTTDYLSNLGGYGAPPPYYGLASTDNDIEKRQTCVLVSAPIGGVMATWCNNYLGTTTLTFTSWETTVTAGTSFISPTAPTVIDRTSQSWTSSSSNPVSNSPAASTAPSSPGSPTSATNPQSSCGQLGPFEISFDNLPENSVFPDQIAKLPPIFSPYDLFFWAPGWSYAPLPMEPFNPYDGDQLGVFNMSLAATQSISPGGLNIVDRGFGAGFRDNIDAYWFNATSAQVGCAYDGPGSTEACHFAAEGYRFDNAAGKERIVVTQYLVIEPCQQTPCPWSRFEFNEEFYALTTLSFYANIAGKLRDFYVDDLQLIWWNNTCDAGLLRSNSRK